MDNQEIRQLLNDTEEKTRLEGIIKQSRMEYYNGNFWKVIREIVIMIIFVILIDRFNVSAITVTALIFAYCANSEVIRLEKVVNAQIELQKIKKN